MKITKHQQKPCKMCADNATKYNHCAFCGSTFKNLNLLLDHLDDCPDYVDNPFSNTK